MAPVSSMLPLIVGLLNICNLASSIPIPHPAQGISLAQAISESGLNVSGSPSPSPSPGPDDPTIRVKVRRTFLIITQKPDGKTMEISQSAPLFDIAMDQIRTNLRIAREQKKSTVLPGPFTLDYGELRLEAWQYSAAKAPVTWELMEEFITGLESNILRLGNVESDIDLYHLKDDNPQSAGHAVIAFRKDTPWRVSSSNTTTLDTTEAANPLLLSGSRNGNTTASLQADSYEYQVPNTHTIFVINKKLGGRTLPVVDALQLFNHVRQDLKDEIDAHGEEETSLVDKSYQYYYNDLALEAHDTTGEFTYHMTEDVVSGLQDVFWRVGYGESKIDVYSMLARNHRLKLGTVTVALQDAPQQWLNTSK